MTNGKPLKTRCAIYTRKSSEEGLEQEFNSLDAQREAAAAYIASQKHEGWTAIDDHFDDGGFSGGSMVHILVYLNTDSGLLEHPRHLTYWRA
ncbi:hypothetical protein GCM10023116_00190 [Kistimonas scapharcae]|uniref:Resolvase/invertase-type recombinase catalytic domain-containing protein n=1 Tax=Kistimonas scapharcae TaxID=1036133 RepID=A0ABP8UVW6_9GAMM